MRVVAGKCRSIPLVTPPGRDVRPTTDRIKETLFNMISDRIPGADFLDLFAGSGQIGIEALSRGARHCVFADKDNGAINAINENLKKTRLSEEAEVLKGDVKALIGSGRITGAYDIIFMDPPYAFDGQDKLILSVIEAGLLSDGGVLILEADIDTDISEEAGVFKLQKEKRYKTNKHLFFEKAVQ